MALRFDAVAGNLRLWLTFADDGSAASGGRGGMMLRRRMLSDGNYKRLVLVATGEDERLVLRGKKVRRWCGSGVKIRLIQLVTPER